MEGKLSEGRFMLYILSAIMLLVLIRIFHADLDRVFDPNNYVAIHTILEFFSIAVSFSIFTYGWKRYSEIKSRKMLFLAIVFITVAMLDLLHTISFKGMPYFLTESSIAKATWFWIAARSVESLFMLIILLFPDKQVKKDLSSLFLCLSMFIVGLITYIIFFYEQSLPLLVIEGEGTTTLKNTLEYVISGIHFLSIIVSLYLYNEHKKATHLYLTLAFTFLFLSELIFTIYQSVYDIDNFTGHIYKVIGFYFIMKGFYFSKSNDYLNVKTEADQLLKEHYGIIFKVTKEAGDYVHYYYGGKLLEGVGLTEVQVNGKTIYHLLPEKADIILKRYELSWSTQERVSFELEVEETLYIVSLSPVIKGEEVVELVGSMMEISHYPYFHNQTQPWKRKHLG